jgi:hypothetical protein
VEPFTIQCTTCQSKLRVRDAALLHQIVNCPKCSSMIQVELPGRLSVPAAGQSNVDSTAVTKEAIPSDLSSLATNPLNPGAASRPTTPASSPAVAESNDWENVDFRLAPLEDSTAHLPLDAARELDAARHSSSHWQLEAPPLNPSEEWSSPKAAQSRQYLLVAFIGLGGIILAGLSFVLFLRWVNREPVGTEQALARNSEQADPARENRIGLDNAFPPGDPASRDALTTDQDSVRAAEGTDGNIATNDPGANRDDLAVPDGLREDPAEADIGDSPIVDRSLPDAGDAPPALADGVGPSMDPEVESDPNAADISPALELPRQLAAFEQLLNYQVIPVLPDTEVLPSAPPLTAEELGLQEGSSSAAAPPQPTAIDVAQRGRVELPPVIIRDRPLASVVNFWTHLSGVPTIANLDALSAAGIDHNVNISLQQVTPQMARAMGQTLAASVNARLVERNNAYWSIQPTLEQVQQTLPQILNLEGLIQDADQEWLQQAILELLPDLEGKTELQGLSLVFTAAEDDEPESWFAWFNLVRLMANWQMAKTGALTIDAPALDERLLRESLTDPAKLAALDKRLAFFSTESLPSGQLLSRCADEVGLQCWIDWPNVGASGLTPSTQFSAVTLNREFRRVLADYAAQYTLVVAILDERNLWLTSPLRYRSEARLYIVPAGGRSVQQWQQELRLLTPIDFNGNSLLRIIATPDEQWMLVRCCPPALRF